MEFCPEVAVLQSAFQLLEQKAGENLGALRKESCKDFTHIVSTAVQEICQGLEHDNEAEDRLLWQQKSHLLVFYALITKKYRHKQETKQGRVPVLTVLDTLTHPLPTVSPHFYFELVKLCSWEQCFIDSLSYLDTSLAVQILHDVTDHCKIPPVTDTDVNLVSIIMDNLLSCFLTSRPHNNNLLQNLTTDLYRKQKFIWTVYPDDSGIELNDNSPDSSSEHATNIGEPSAVQCVGEETESWDVTEFWSVFLQNNPTFILLALEYSCRKHLETEPDLGLGIGVSQKVNRYLAQLLFLWYSVHVGQGSPACDSWFVNNIGEVCAERAKAPGMAPVKSALNYQLIDCLVSQIPNEKLLMYIHRCLLAIQKMVQNDHDYEESAVLVKNGCIEIASNMQVRGHVLLRMFQGTLDTCQRTSENKDCLGLVQWLLGGEDDKDIQKSEGIIGGHVLFGDSWDKDVTLPVLLWRISSNQLQAEACMELLLCEECQSFWFLESGHFGEVLLYLVLPAGRVEFFSLCVYNVLENGHEKLLGTSSRVLKLMKIASSIQSDSQREINQRILSLILRVFSELPFPDQDYIVMIMYKQRPVENDMFVADQSFAVNTTNVFNKLTAERDDQVQREILQLCLTDPVAIVRQAVEICTRNEEQAISSAKVLQHLWKTCGCHHEQYHPEVSLLCTVVHDFVTSVKLTDKEQKHFITFLTCVMQVECGSQALLSPLEFLLTTVLPHTSVVVFNLNHTPIGAKFSLDLLMTSLTASCNKKCDWSKVDLEPVVVVVVLAQVLHECVALWDGGHEEELTSTLDTDLALHSGSGQFSLAEKVLIRDKTCRCLNIMCDMLEKGYISVDAHRVEWLLQETSCLHWSVQYRLLPVLTACDHDQYATEWAGSLQDSITGTDDQVTTLLLLVSLDATLVDKITPEVKLDSSDIITGLVQAWPHLLQEECVRVVLFLEKQLMQGGLPLAYRLCTPSLMPFTHWTSEHGAILGMSQILRDMVLTLTLHENNEEPSTVQMLAHVVQNYVAAIKARCGYTIKPLEVQLFVQYQIFLHVCDVTRHLPVRVAELTWVLLLNIATQFKAICKDNSKHGDRGTQQTVEKLTYNWEQGMVETVRRLRWCDEREMILKKLQ